MKNIKEIIIFIILLLVFISIPIILFYNIRIDNNIEKSSNIEIYKNVLNDFENVYSYDIPKELIYTTAYIDPASEIDLTNQKALYDKADIVIVGTIIEKKKGTMIEEYGYAGIPGMVSVDTILKGSILNNNIEIFSNGGYCTVKEYVDVMSKTKKEKIDKMGVSTLTPEEQEEKYMIFNYKYGKNFEEGKRYVIMLEKVNGKLVSMSNYGFIEVSSEDSINSLSDIINITNK